MFTKNTFNGSFVEELFFLLSIHIFIIIKKNKKNHAKNCAHYLASSLFESIHKNVPILMKSQQQQKYLLFLPAFTNEKWSLWMKFVITKHYWYHLKTAIFCPIKYIFTKNFKECFKKMLVIF